MVASEVHKQVWPVRKVGLGILMSHTGDLKPVSFIEDLAVPVERLGGFANQMVEILKPHDTTVGFEPSEIHTLRDEYLDIFPNQFEVVGLAKRVWMIDEFLI